MNNVDQIVTSLAEVVASLHDEKGDRSFLLLERDRLAFELRQLISDKQNRSSHDNPYLTEEDR